MKWGIALVYSTPFAGFVNLNLVAVLNLSMALTVLSAETMFAIPLLIQRNSITILYVGGMGKHVVWIVWMQMATVTDQSWS